MLGSHPERVCWCNLCKELQSARSASSQWQCQMPVIIFSLSQILLHAISTILTLPQPKHILQMPRKCFNTLFTADSSSHTSDISCATSSIIIACFLESVRGQCLKRYSTTGAAKVPS